MIQQITLREAIEGITNYYWMDFEKISFSIKDKFNTEKFSAKGLESFIRHMQEFEYLERNVDNVLFEFTHLKDKRKTVISGIRFILEPLR